MATAGFERGVSLRSPARFSVAADRLIELWRTTADPADTALADAVTDAWMRAEGYRLHTYQTVTGMLEGRPIGAEASLNKIFWSEMDVRHPRARPRFARSRGGAGRRRRRAVARRLHVLAVRADLCRHQRDPAQHHRRPCSRTCRRARDERFSFTDDQRLFADGLRDLLAQGVPAERRARCRGTTAPATPLRSGSTSTRWACSPCSLPKRRAVWAATIVDAVLLLFRQLGRAAVPGPVVEHMVAAPVALRPPESRHRSSRSLPTSSGPYVPHAARRRRVLTPAGLLTGFTAEHRRIASTAAAACSVTGGSVSGGSPSAGSNGVADAAVADRLALAAAAYLVGLGERMIEIAAEYARQREQFGKPIGSFQAVKHLLAERPAGGRVRQGAASIGRRGASPPAPPPPRATCRWPRRSPTRPHTAASRNAMQVHGGIGYTWEADLQLWMKKAWALMRAYGDTTFHRRRVAAHVLGVAAR